MTLKKTTCIKFKMKIAFISLFFVFVLVECENKTFIPSSSWQIVEDGQMIPPGLHVRINLQTGKKEAKLLSEEDTEENKQTSLINIEGKEPSYVDVKELTEALKNVNKDSKLADSEKIKQFKSYDELKRDLKHLNMDIKTDIEVLNEFMDEFNHVILESGSYDAPSLREILKEIEYLVHQHDNAVEFSRLGGFSALVLPCLNKTKDNEVRSQVLRIVGSASQSNPEVQLAAVEAGCITALLKILALEQTAIIRLRCFFAISCIIRNFPRGQHKFVLDGGLSLITSLFDDTKQANEIIRLKIVNMLTDILLESVGIPENSERKKQVNEIALEQSLRDTGWCKKVSDWVMDQVDWKNVAAMQEDDVNHDIVNGAADFLLALAETCLADYVTNIHLINTINYARIYYADLALIEAEDGNIDSYYGDILQKLRSFAAILAQNSEYKDEL